MKLNLLQKLLLIFYVCAFIYFSILHVPFKIKNWNEVQYDSLFSNKANVDVLRLVLILLVITILAGILFFLLKTLNLKTPSIKWTKAKQYGIIAFSVIVLIIISAVFYRHYKASNVNWDRTQHPDTTLLIDSIKNDLVDMRTLIDSSQSSPSFCSPERALEIFSSHMEFNFPDWKIYDKPVVIEKSYCVYDIRFTTKDPRYEFFRKEVTIVRITFSDHNRYFFETIRGNIY